MDVASNRPLRRTLVLVGGAVLFVSAVVLEPRTAADMAVVSASTAALLAGLYLSRRAERRTVEKAGHEEEALAVPPDVVPEEDVLPRRNPFDGDDRG